MTHKEKSARNFAGWLGASRGACVTRVITRDNARTQKDRAF